MKKIITLVLASLLTATLIAYHSIFSFTHQAELVSISNQPIKPSLHCYQNDQAPVVDKQGMLNVLVWNIYKQNRANWQTSLAALAQDKQLVLLQEASMTKDLRNWILQQGWFGSQVDAFKAFDTAAGVLNLSWGAPSKACAYTELEPWLRLPKSALYAVYPLSSGQQLAVVNIHAVNFTYGTTEYHRQLRVLAEQLAKHQGPIIVAGDFNSWSEERMAVMSKTLQTLGLREVNYQPDNRIQFITGLPLDHLFYRGLEVETAEAPISDASDHNPIVVRFRLTANG